MLEVGGICVERESMARSWEAGEREILFVREKFGSGSVEAAFYAKVTETLWSRSGISSKRYQPLVN